MTLKFRRGQASVAIVHADQSQNSLNPALLAILVCPECENSVIQNEPKFLECPACLLKYPVVDGIPIMLGEKALPAK